MENVEIKKATKATSESAYKAYQSDLLVGLKADMSSDSSKRVFFQRSGVANDTAISGSVVPSSGVARNRGTRDLRKVRAYEEIVMRQFRHRLIMGGKASKAKSILSKSLSILAATPVFAEWAASEAAWSKSLISNAGGVKKGGLRSTETAKSSSAVGDSATASAVGDSATASAARSGLLFSAVAAPSRSHLDFLLAKQQRCRWAQSTTGRAGCTSVNPITWRAFLYAIEKVKPIVEPKTVKRAGRNVCVPSEISTARQLSVAIRWVIESARNRSGSSMVGSLAREFEGILSGSLESGSLKKRDQWHRLAQANRANAGLRAR
jgi:ribosomal protein S7